LGTSATSTTIITPPISKFLITSSFLRPSSSASPPALLVAGSDGVLADACSPPSLYLFNPRSDPAKGPS
nr:hypothetical protein [Tanacetum cinerariifolium]